MVMAYEGNYSSNYPYNFIGAVKSILNAVGGYLSINKIQIILSTTNPNTNLSFNESEMSERVNYVEQSGIHALGIWSMNESGGFPQDENLWRIISDFESKTSNESSNSYNVTFTQSGLPLGTKWYVNLSNSQIFSGTGETITFSEPNGTYSYTIETVNKNYALSPSSGTFSVNGSNVNILFSFQLVTYEITFTESGLPSGNWYVNITGQASSGPIHSSQTSYSIPLPNGSYSYTISTGNKAYKPSYTGSFTVNGASVPESITFSEVTYTITFTEYGLPWETSWSVTLNGTTETSTTNSISFTEPNGTYSFTIASFNGYSASPYSGSKTVNGANVNQATTFKSVATTTSHSSNDSPNYIVTAVVVIAATIGAAIVVMGKKKK